MLPHGLARLGELSRLFGRRKTSYEPQEFPIGRYHELRLGQALGHGDFRGSQCALAAQAGHEGTCSAPERPFPVRKGTSPVCPTASKGNRPKTLIGGSLNRPEYTLYLNGPHGTSTVPRSSWLERTVMSPGWPIERSGIDIFRNRFDEISRSHLDSREILRAGADERVEKRIAVKRTDARWFARGAASCEGRVECRPKRQIEGTDAPSWAGRRHRPKARTRTRRDVRVRIPEADKLRKQTVEDGVNRDMSPRTQEWN